jgi:hypothetical protein
MKRSVMAAFAALAVLPVAASAAKPARPIERLYIGHIAAVNDPKPTTWAISGYEIIPLRVSDGNFTPIMRSEQYDARMVEIFTRTEAPPLSARDIRAETINGHHYVVVRNYLLAEVKPQDARAVGMSEEALARQWVASCKRSLPHIAPIAGRFGI